MFLSFYDLILVYLSETNKAGLRRVRSDCRIGPHNKDIISILYGSLLGDAHAEKRAEGKGTRISFYQEDRHSEYLL
jgi:LAGLIDADG DNA endonuclease family